MCLKTSWPGHAEKLSGGQFGASHHIIVLVLDAPTATQIQADCAGQRLGQKIENGAGIFEKGQGLRGSAEFFYSAHVTDSIAGAALMASQAQA